MKSYSGPDSSQFSKKQQAWLQGNKQLLIPLRGFCWTFHNSYLATTPLRSSTASGASSVETPKQGNKLLIPLQFPCPEVTARVEQLIKGYTSKNLTLLGKRIISIWMI